MFYLKNSIISLSIFLITLYGAVFNQFVIYHNNNKMPVYADWGYTNSIEHFIYTNISQVNYFLLTDIIPIEYKNREGRISIGDILMISGILSQIILFLSTLNESLTNAT